MPFCDTFLLLSHCLPPKPVMHNGYMSICVCVCMFMIRRKWQQKSWDWHQLNGAVAKGAISKKDLSFPAEINSQSLGLPRGPPLLASSPGPSCATSLCLCGRAGFLFNLSRPHPNPELSPRSSKGPLTCLFFNEGKIPSPVSCRDLINTCLEFRLLIQGTAPQLKLRWGSLSTS